MSDLLLRKVKSADHIEGSAITVTLFRGAGRRVCAWYIGPVDIAPTGIDMPYLPRSGETLASVAILRALETARRLRIPLWVVDPDDLWEPAWRS